MSSERPRRRLADGGSRYRFRLPFQRDLDEAEQDAVGRALQSAAFSRDHEYGEDAINPERVAVDETRAVVDVLHEVQTERPPTDIQRQLTHAIREWRQEHAPLTEPVVASRERTLASLDADALDLDREPEEDIVTYALAYPERPLTDEEVMYLNAVDGVEASPGFVLLLDACSSVYGKPVRRSLSRIEPSLPGFVNHDADIRGLGFYPGREFGTLAAVDEAAREALLERAQANTPHQAVEEDTADADTSEEVNV
jgi:hypothetical protein